MTRSSRILSLILVAFSVSSGVVPDTAFAGDPVATDLARKSNPARSQWFRSLRQPDTGLSCCDISDCKRTEADWKQGSWWANVRGLKRPVPPEKVLEKPRSIDGEAYVCATEIGNPAYATIYCFIPPNMAM